MVITGIDHVVITVEDVEQTLAFYVDGLGMTLDRRNDRLALTFGNQKINIHRRKAEFTPAARQVTYGSLDICLLAQGDIQQIKRELEARGLTIELGVVPRTGACGPIDSLYLRDPDGNLVEISVYRTA
ncbi:VOC family protein [Edwardsiella tarda]|uniref:VOC family virulence protein n=2 Tax=Edwardsiella tarda TaxID=636 RepID=A0A2A7U4C9_EDWTA|nr:VOC family protein [Edwardsiella tarda]AKH89526.1 VOC family protein [Edwardsiella tarda]ATI63159.1 VOC family virulence protein [Edwardsiella tarda]EFE23572.1 glyoxalase family protein [Edwardsiella tarda ATCC 23685]PEH73159.1 VOC family virulence protein [Edwardsiella tarda]UCQ16804.1 VOC family protein [Edwardsiella tarda]